jgi:ABC-type multidrug transport system ATPase subunit
MFAPTGGFATIAGKDIRTNMQTVRQEIGICLQQNCLFPNLTVKEYIEFFSRIKGVYSKMKASEADQRVSSSVQDVALSENCNTLAKHLSGGMMRKLSVAIAFCGDSKIVFLDEPTSGMVSIVVGSVLRHKQPT